ncbi:MAG: signal recognition particle-docking protein FtsY [Ignavibacteriaceae bacterium]
MNLLKNLNLGKLKTGLSKTRDKIYNSINEAVSGKALLDEKTLDEIEEILITSDIGFETTEKIIENARIALKSEKDRSNLNIIEAVKSELQNVLNKNKYDNKNGNELDNYKPYIILVVGVNGAGKTTTIGKLAHNYKQSGLKVIVGAADTFRAAANEQLDIWADRAGVDIFKKKHGSDPSSVAFDVLEKAIKEKYDIVLIDTAGRLHNKSELMDELRKLRKVIQKLLNYAPNETLLVLDGNTGQNALLQAEEFNKITKIDGVVVTKLDGTAKGGVIFQLCSKINVPVKYIGVGEGIDDLQTFEPGLYLSAIFEN